MKTKFSVSEFLGNVAKSLRPIYPSHFQKKKLLGVPIIKLLIFPEIEFTYGKMSDCILGTSEKSYVFPINVNKLV